MKPESSLPYLQELATCPYPESDQSSLFMCLCCSGVVYMGPWCHHTTPTTTTTTTGCIITRRYHDNPLQHCRLRPRDQHPVYSESDVITALRTWIPKYVLRFPLSNLSSPWWWRDKASKSVGIYEILICFNLLVYFNVCWSWFYKQLLWRHTDQRMWKCH
jgi:hypothetical protein